MEIAIIILLVINLVMTVVLFATKKGGGATAREVENIVKSESDYRVKTMQGTVNGSNAALLNAIKMHTETQGANTDKFMTYIAQNAERQDKRQQEFIAGVEQKLENMRTSMERTLSDVRRENGEQMEKMRVVVEEKMQSTLAERLNQSFGIIGEQLDDDVVEEIFGKFCMGK